MQYRISATSGVVSLDSINERLGQLDPAASIDVDAAGRLRIATFLSDAEVLLALGLAGVHAAPMDLERVPSECCGGCGG
jgi:hypothetical protein